MGGSLVVEWIGPGSSWEGEGVGGGSTPYALAARTLDSGLDTSAPHHCVWGGCWLVIVCVGDVD